MSKRKREEDVPNAEFCNILNGNEIMKSIFYYSAVKQLSIETVDYTGYIKEIQH